MDRRRRALGAAGAGSLVIKPANQSYFSIVSKTASNKIYWAMSTSSVAAKTIYYSTDESTWTAVTPTTSTGTLITTLASGQRVFLKGSHTQYSTATALYHKFVTSGIFDVYGNIMSLINSDNFIGTVSLSSTYAFCGLFRANTKLRSASSLIMPATTLTNYCYSYMFHSCTGMTTGPSLPATAVKKYCYSYMYYGCSALQTGPALPAITMATGCYQYMFKNCTSLKSGPVLKATAMKNYSYRQLFYGCTKLNYIKAFIQTTPSTTYTPGWTYNVASSGTFVKHTSATWSVSGSNGTPTGWTIVTASS